MSSEMERGARSVQAVDSGVLASALARAGEALPTTRGTTSWTGRVRNRALTRAALQGVEAAAATGAVLAQVA